ncbi:hybrid sensor histidine kinase/response regulator [Desulfovibrio inopinatus]|uniref:hybrid sensor histidine kinase/response regulator n=1 Tax=Desulfovibrio inopinatus TaxID=102109 RepID=UPI0003FF944A|nr:PAS domain-containing sensor histidine kinase [Desulfovibrio inopinatus]
MSRDCPPPLFDQIDPNGPDDKCVGHLLHYEERLGALIQQNVDGFIVTDPDGHVLYANSAARHMLQREGEELVGQHLSLSAADKPQEIELQPHDSSSIIAELRETPVFWERNPARMLTLRDITVYKRAERELQKTKDELEQRVAQRTETLRHINEQLIIEINERKRIETQLTKSEARFRAILEDQTELICRYLPDGRLSYVNDAYVRFVGKGRLDLLNTNYIPHIPGEDLEHIRQHVIRLTKENPVTTFEHRVILDDGRIEWQRWTHRAIFDEEGQLIEYQAVGQNITERKLAEEELRENKAFLRQIIDTVPCPIFVKDETGAFILVNKAMATLYGSTPEGLVGRRGADFNADADADETEPYLREDRQVIDSGNPLFVPKTSIPAPKGERRWFTKTKLPLPGKRQVLGVAVDITEVIEAEAERTELEKKFRQAQKMQALGTLAGGIAHDFNNMIFAILGFARLALNLTEKDSKLEEYLRQIQSAGMRASELVRQILTFSRQTEQETTVVHISNLIKEIQKMLKATLPPNIQIQSNIMAPSDSIMGDPIQIHQVLMNLCTNAAHAMRENGGQLKIELQEAEQLPVELTTGNPSKQPSDFLEIIVSDSGHGIPTEIIDRIFDPFYTTKEMGEGTGMGLSVVHGIVKNHSGTIHVESTFNVGSRFHVLLPKHAESQTTPHVEEKSSEGGTERILFIDDEELITSMAYDMLTGLGYTVTAFTSPVEAIRCFMNNPNDFDLVITDQTMPMMTGAELLAEVMALRVDIPTILITGYSENMSPQQAQKLGITEFAMKPLVEERFAHIIRQALDQERTLSSS